MNYKINHKNIYRIDFIEKRCDLSIPQSVLFNITQISEDKVKELLNNGMYRFDERVIVVSQNQLKNLSDKEVI